MRRSFVSPAKPLVSVLTPSIPSRARMLVECEASVKAQLFTRWEHLIDIDTHQEGCATVMNRLADQATADWLLPLADDDLLLPGALEVLYSRTEEADVIYSPPLVTGNEDRWWFFQTPPAIPSFALIHREVWEKVGGYDTALSREEDRAFWNRALEVGAEFECVNEPTWVYRQHKGNKSFNLGVAA